MSAEAVAVVGIGAEGAAGLGQAAGELIAHADEIWGGERLLAMVDTAGRKTVPLDKNLTRTLQSLTQRPPGQRVVILASGDPGFYGIAASLLQILPPEEVVVYPQASLLQSAFARMRIPWQDAALTSAHARPLGEVIGLARRYSKVGILTDPQQNPAWIAERMLAAGIPDCRAVVLEDLGGVGESITDTRLKDLPGRTFRPLNVLLLIHDPDWEAAPALNVRPDDAYRHKEGLITKRDVRTISISRLEIRETDVLWDVGAGSGALSIEMAETAWRGQVYAIEKDGVCLACLQENLTRCGVTNLNVVAGEAPRALAGLPAPHAVAIGGSGGKLVEILSEVARRVAQGSRIVANFTLLENLMLACDWMRSRGWETQISECRFSYGVTTGGGTRLAPQNPVYVLSATVRKGENG